MVLFRNEKAWRIRQVNGNPSTQQTIGCIMKGLAPQTSEVFEEISRLECIKPFVLVGGTALSLQLNLRQRDDLDFMRWKQSPKDKLEVGISNIKHELESIGKIDEMDIGDFNFVEFVIKGVKLSFYAAPRKKIPSMQVIPYLNNLQLADIKSIGAMKMEAMLRRSKFRRSIVRRHRHLSDIRV